MPTGSIQVYASVAGQAAPLAGVQVSVLDESGVTVARLTTDEAGAAEATNLTAPNASYSLQETNTTVRPYAVYRLRWFIVVYKYQFFLSCSQKSSP